MSMFIPHKGSRNKETAYKKRKIVVETKTDTQTNKQTDRQTDRHASNIKQYQPNQNMLN